MLQRKIAGLAAALCLIASIPLTPAVAADDSYDMQVSVNLAGEKKAISPYIYGVNDHISGSNLKNVTTHNARQGGNRYTGYNWETNWSNAGEDWQHSSDTNIGDLSDGTAFAARHFSENCEKYGVPFKLATLQMAGYVSADKSGTVATSEVAPSARWNKVEFRKDGELSLEPDLNDGVVYMDEYVNFLVKTLGDSTTSTGIQAYSLDNEPVLWNDTHPLLHPDEVTNSELVSKSIELAKVVKEIDPNAQVFGPAFWGMLPCMQIGEGENFSDPDWQAVKSDYKWYLDYYLKQMADAEKEAGKRLLDVIDVHYYAQDCATDEARLQAARSLYDPDYVENSWLQPWAGQYFPFLPNIQESIDKYYPNTKIAVSEYNLANIADEKNTGKSVVSGIAETEALGAFAKNGVYFATYWGTIPDCPYVASGINLYTNYDGEGSSFGDTLVEASTTDLSKAAAFASIKGDDDSTVTMTLSNKDMNQAEKAVIKLDGTATNYQSAVVYAITQDSSDIRIIDVQNDISGNQLTVELPALSVAQIVISDKATDKTVYEAPDIQTKEVTYQYDELELSANGFPMIPLEDKQHLKKIVINATAASNAGSSYGGGGGGLCFNHVVRNGSTAEEWGSKSVNWTLGTADIEIPFDDEFTVVKDPVENTTEVINGSTNDEYAEFQGNWWKYSEKSPSGDDVTVTYNSVKLVYEFDNSETQPTEPDTTESTPSEPITPSESTPPADVKYGDVDNDGDVDIVDVLRLNQYLLSLAEIDSVGEKNADVDNNGKLNDADAMNILKSLVDLVKLPVA